ncbi:MAG: hypothetical protein PVSMB3_10140 [Candidatus Dormibacteraceae bacterium]
MTIRFVVFGGWAGVASFVLFAGGLILEGSAGPSPGFKDTVALSAYLHDHAALLISGGLSISLALMLELVLVVGFRDLVRDKAADWSSAATLFLLFYVVAYPLGLVATGLLIAAATEAGSVGDASAIRALWGGGFSLLGAVSYLPLMCASVIYAVVVRGTGILPKWTAWIGWVAALGAAAAIPAAFGGSGAYSQLAPAPGLIQGVPGLVWLLVVSVSMVRRSRLAIAKV